MHQSVLNYIPGAALKSGVTAFLVVKAYPLLHALTQIGIGAERMQV
jgi:hypothetical protein